MPRAVPVVPAASTKKVLAGLLEQGPVITPDHVQLWYPDPRRELSGVRLEVDWELGAIDPEFLPVDGGWTLNVPRPDAWRLEYQLTTRVGGEYRWTCDPGNVRRGADPLGGKAGNRVPHYPRTGWVPTQRGGPPRPLAPPP